MTGVAITGVSHDWAAFTSACDVLERVLAGPARAEILDALLAPGGETGSRRLRSALRTHVFRLPGGWLPLHPWVAALDERTRREGFHVVLEWHEVAYRFIEDDIPVVLLDAVAGLEQPERGEREALAVVLDVYFLYLLALAALRAWDDGDGGAGLDRVTGLLGHLGGPHGSGVRFVDDAETLLLLAVSTFEPDDLAYDRLLARIRALDDAHRVRFARTGGPLMGSHLRWGFGALYEHDLGRMRADNFIDYPWLFLTVATLVRRYADRSAAGAPEAERVELAGALIAALSPDPDALLGEPPASLGSTGAEHAEVRALLGTHAGSLLRDAEAHRPVPGRYSPLGLHVNFPHNLTFAAALVAVLDRGVPSVSLDRLVACAARDEAASDAALALARRLTAFAAAHPEPRGDRQVLGLWYDDAAAAQAFERTTAALGQRDGAPSTIRP